MAKSTSKNAFIHFNTVKKRSKSNVRATKPSAGSDTDHSIVSYTAAPG
jgi:hypothetical protein